MPHPHRAQCKPVRLTLTLLCVSFAWGASPTRAEKLEEKEPGYVGFELGAFVMKEYQPLQDVTTKLIFTAHASVEETKAADFDRLLQTRRIRVRDQVLVAARLAQPEELQDPELRLLRRRILLRLRHALPELAIEEIYLSEYQLFKE